VRVMAASGFWTRRLCYAWTRQKDLHLENHERWGSLACEVYSAHDLQARSLAALGMTFLE